MVEDRIVDCLLGGATLELGLMEASEQEVHRKEEEVEAGNELSEYGFQFLPPEGIHVHVLGRCHEGECSRVRGRGRNVDIGYRREFSEGFQFEE